MPQSLDDLLAETAPLWTGAEFQQFFRLARGTYYYRLNRGDIPHIRVAGQVRIPRDSIRALIASQMLPQPEQADVPKRSAADLVADEGYRPFGQPADSYRIALGEAEASKEEP